jgi:hypothetical protein
MALATAATERLFTLQNEAIAAAVADRDGAAA